MHCLKVNKATSVIESEKVIDLETYGKTLNLMIQFGNHHSHLKSNTLQPDSTDESEESRDPIHKSDDFDNFVLVLVAILKLCLYSDIGLGLYSVLVIQV